MQAVGPHLITVTPCHLVAREENHSNDDEEQVEGKESIDTKEEILEALVHVSSQLEAWILHPMKKQWMLRLDSVGGFCLFHCQTKVFTLILAHNSKTRFSY